MRHSIERREGGFTLIELLVVIAILGLLVSLILIASADGVRRAEERGTQSLITKLETALNDRLDALLNAQPPVNPTHRFLASINAPNANSNNAILPVGSGTSNSDDRRAQIIAQFDYIRAEQPDVFFLNSLTMGGTNSPIAAAYPLNFAAAPYPQGANSLTSPIVAYTTGAQYDGGSWALPLGNFYGGLPFINGQQLYPTATNPPISTYPVLPTTGMFGASFSAAASVYKNLYTAAAADLVAASPGCSVNFQPGLDGVDNNGDGLIDELISPAGGNSEIIVTGATIQDFATKVGNRLGNHTHKTARAEVLYAILVDGLSPLGSAFSRDDFTAREVQDTDGDGMPEFVDAWGEPLQFFRWPVYYGGPLTSGAILGTSDSQVGWNTYAGPSATRQQDPLDPNQILVSPGWWSHLANPALALQATTFAPPNGSGTNSATYGPGPGAIAFMNYFHSLVDPNFSAAAAGGWDRGVNFSRREYFTKFLILSAGADREPGVGQFAKDYALLVDSSSFDLQPLNSSGQYIVPFPNGNLTMEQNAELLIYIENQAAVMDPVYRASSSSGSFFEIPDSLPVDGSGKPKTATFFLSNTTNADDITNHNISGVSTGVR